MKGMTAMKYMGLLCVLTLLTACAGQSIQSAIKAYEQQTHRIELGQSKEYVLGILNTTQTNLSSQQKKASDIYMEGDKRIEVHFFRSKSFSDGLVTDDEFTPYVFTDDILTAIGVDGNWRPKKHKAQTRDKRRPRILEATFTLGFN